MAQRRIRPKRIAQLQRRFLREMGATPAEIRRYQPILTAQIGAESNFTEGIGSPAGARDIAQFMPGTARSYGVRLGDNRIKDDIRGQVKYMLPLLRKYGVEGALRGYNAGVGAIERSKGFSETNDYVSRIRSTAGEYRGMGAGAAGVEGESSPFQMSGGGGRPGRYTIPGVDNSQLRQQAMLQYLDVRGKPGALLELKAALDSAQDVPSRQVKVPGSSLNSGPTNSRKQGGKLRKHGELLELFWQGQGGINVKNGKVVPQGFVSGHQDHVHVAARQKDLLKIGRLAEQMGLHVGENPAFGGVDPVHVQNSYHYGRTRGREHDRAIDVSGDAAKMRAFAHRVARLYGV